MPIVINWDEWFCSDRFKIQTQVRNPSLESINDVEDRIVDSAHICQHVRHTHDVVEIGACMTFRLGGHEAEQVFQC